MEVLLVMTRRTEAYRVVSGDKGNKNRKKGEGTRTNGSL